MIHQIITTDLHLTDNPADEYRWGLFPFLREKIRELSAGVKSLFILGDITQDKDNHSATLVNRVVDNLVSLYKGTGLHELIILRGNHDGLGDVAFFQFLNNFPYFKVITAPTTIRTGLTSKILLLPHSRNPSSDWTTIEFSEVKTVYMHATISGSVSESGYSLKSADDANWITQYKHLNILSGDVHVPQKIANVEYVGAPYPIRFGDKFKGRILHFDGKKRSEWHYPTIKKVKLALTANSAEGFVDLFNLKEGDQVKIELSLGKESLHEWVWRKKMLEEICEENKILLCGIELRAKQKLKIGSVKSQRDLTITPDEAFDRYVKKTTTSEEAKEVGRKILYAVSGKPPKLKLGKR